MNVVIATDEGTEEADRPLSRDPLLRFRSDTSVRPVAPRSLLLSVGAVPIGHGRMAVLRPGSNFELHTEANGYSGVAIERTDSGARELAGRSFVSDPSPRISFLGEWIAEELALPSIALPSKRSQDPLEHLANLILQIAFAQSSRRPPGEPHLARAVYCAQRARQAIENFIYTVQGVGEVLADFPLSYRRLSRCITDQYGYPPKELQLRARLQEGKRLLRETDWSVVTVALELGFSSPQHFSTVFRAREGVSPGGWRESTRGPSFRR